MSPQALKPTAQVGRAIMRRAGHLAPRSGDGEGIPYADSFALKSKPQGIVAGKFQNRRVAVTIVNTARHGPVVEWGSHAEGAPRPGRRVMLRAGLAYGDAGSIGGML